MKNTDKTSRTAAVSGAGRTTFSFDPETWALIDKIAGSQGATWQEWAARAVAERPGIGKASALRAALAEEVLIESAADVAMQADLPESHPIVGTGYYRLDDDTLKIELDGAQITTRDDSFEGFTLLIGTRSKSFGSQPFVCIQNRLKDALHLFIAPEVEQ